MRRSALAIIAGVCVLAAFVVSCGEDDPSAPGNPPLDPNDFQFQLVEAFPGLVFVNPVDLQHAGDGSGRIFVVEKDGRIIVFDSNDPTSTSTFLDISGPVDSSGNEMGLLGLAFHPDYANNGWFFVYYIVQNNGRQGRLSRFSVSGNPDVADVGSEAILLEVAQFAGNHNGGAVTFDHQQYLYLALGDGGGGGDDNDNGQDRTTLLGSVLRLDVNSNSNSSPYHEIPASNPFVGNSNGWREEIYAYGLRNPWRMTFDSVSRTLWAGDVGQGQREEINVIESGNNYGWDCREGGLSYQGPPGGPSQDCAGASGFTEPVVDYDRGDGNSVTGGYVYRGPTLSSLVGTYVFADYGSGRIWAYDSGGQFDTVALQDASFRISSFGVGEDGELYLFSYSGSGRIWRLDQQEIQP